MAESVDAIVERHRKHNDGIVKKIREKGREETLTVASKKIRGMKKSKGAISNFSMGMSAEQYQKIFGKK